MFRVWGLWWKPVVFSHIFVIKIETVSGIIFEIPVNGTCTSCFRAVIPRRIAISWFYLALMLVLGLWNCGKWMCVYKIIIILGTEVGRWLIVCCQSVKCVTCTNVFLISHRVISGSYFYILQLSLWSTTVVIMRRLIMLIVHYIISKRTLAS